MQPRSNGAAGGMFLGTSWNACVSEQLSEQPRRRDSRPLLFMTCDFLAGSFAASPLSKSAFVLATLPPRFVSAIFGYVEQVSYLLPVAYVVHSVNSFDYSPPYFSGS